VSDPGFVADFRAEGKAPGTRPHPNPGLMKTCSFSRSVFVKVLLRTGKCALLPPLPPGEGWGEGEGKKTPAALVFCDAHCRKEGSGGVTITSAGVVQRESDAMIIVALGTGKNCAPTERRLAFALTPALSRGERGQGGARTVGGAAKA